jgi:hypothetical protein
MPRASGPQALFAEFDAERAGLRKLVLSIDDATLNWRPKKGERSILENVRHLLFHEQGLERLLRDDFAWSPLRLPPPGLAHKEELRPAGSNPSTDLAEVMAGWDAIHRSVKRRLPKADPSIALTVQKTLRHLRTHTRIIEQVLRNPRRERR